LVSKDDLFFSGDNFTQVIGMQIGVAPTLCLRLEAIENTFRLLVANPLRFRQTILRSDGKRLERTGDHQFALRVLELSLR
jgi:hypothetical protein